VKHTDSERHWCPTYRAFPANGRGEKSLSTQRRALVIIRRMVSLGREASSGRRLPSAWGFAGCATPRPDLRGHSEPRRVDPGRESIWAGLCSGTATTSSSSGATWIRRPRPKSSGGRARFRPDVSLPRRAPWIRGPPDRSAAPEFLSGPRRSHSSPRIATVRLTDSVPIVPGDFGPDRDPAHWCCQHIRRTASERRKCPRSSTPGSTSSTPTSMPRTATNCIKPGQPAQDDHGHGTHVSGTNRCEEQRLWRRRDRTRHDALRREGHQTVKGPGQRHRSICGIDWVTANAAAAKDQGRQHEPRRRGLKMTATAATSNHDALPQGDLQFSRCGSLVRGRGPATIPDLSRTSSRRRTARCSPSRRWLTSMAVPRGCRARRAASRASSSPTTSAAFFSNFGDRPRESGAHDRRTAACASPRRGRTGATTRSRARAWPRPHVAGSVALCFGDGDAAGRASGLTPAQVITKMVATAAAYANANPNSGFDGDPLPSDRRTRNTATWSGGRSGRYPTGRPRDGSVACRTSPVDVRATV
jgi:hypothetical protein